MDEEKREAPASLSEAWNQGLQIGYELNSEKYKLRQIVAKRVKDCRTKAGMTQEEASKKINTNYLTYRGYENCKSDFPLVYLIRLADVFGVTLDYLTGRTNQAEPEKTEQDVSDRLTQLEKVVAELAAQQSKA